MKVKMFKLTSQLASKIEKAWCNDDYPPEAGITVTRILDQVNPQNAVHTVYMDDADLKLIVSTIPEILEYEVEYETGDCSIVIREDEYADLIFALMYANAPASIIYDLTYSMKFGKPCGYGERIITLTHWFCSWFLCNSDQVRVEYLDRDDDIIKNLRIVCMKGFEI